ncbi:neutral amino acid transporter [Haplosporangium sp. Z 27]|nr:neutral amino acid transporter [Haplosporangium sp. Z 27]
MEHSRSQEDPESEKPIVHLNDESPGVTPPTGYFQEAGMMSTNPSEVPKHPLSPALNHTYSTPIVPDQLPRINSPATSDKLRPVNWNIIPSNKNHNNSKPIQPVPSNLRISSRLNPPSTINESVRSGNPQELAESFHLENDGIKRRAVGRAQTYHVPTTSEPIISQMKGPGGFRRHFVENHEEVHGERPKVHHSSSFVHFLNRINSDYEHFAGENFQESRRRSIIVPKDSEKRRASLANSTYSSVKLYTPGQEIQEDEVVIEEEEEDTDEKISFGRAVLMLFKSFIASGILFLPNAFKNGGILFSCIVMVLIAVLCMHSFMLLISCRKLHVGSYGDIGGHFFGRWMRYAVLFMIAISQFGFCCGYCIFFATQFSLAIDLMGGHHLNRIVWIAIFFVLIVPFTLVRNIGKLGISVIIADACIIVGLVYVYVYDIKELARNHGSPSLRLFNGHDFGLFIGTAVFAYEGIGMIIPICGSMRNPEQFPRALGLVLTVVCAILVSFGAMGYAAFGENVQGVILENLPTSSPGERKGREAIQLLYCIAIVLTTPLMLFPCIRIVEHAVFSIFGVPPPGKGKLWKENLVRVLVDLAVAGVAYGAYYKLDTVISFIGSFACCPLLFIFPPLFHIKAFPEYPLWRKLTDVVFIIFGLLVFVYTLIITVENF